MEQQRTLDLAEAFFRAAKRFLLETPGEGESRALAHRFLKALGFDLQRLDRLPAGFCPDCFVLKDALAHAGFTPEEIDASELVADPRLAERLLGPIRDLDGSVRGFWARHPQGKHPQYLFKGEWKNLVPAIGLEVAVPALDNGRLPLILVESPLDALLLQFYGFLHVGAIGGDAGQMTRRRWERLARLGVRRAILVLRTNEVGRRGAAGALENSARAKESPEVSVLAPERLDGLVGPGDFVRARGVPAFRALFEPPVERPPVERPPVEPPPVVSEPAPPPPPPLVVPPPEIPAPPPAPPVRRRRQKSGYCTLHQCEETDCFCFD